MSRCYQKALARRSVLLVVTTFARGAYGQSAEAGWGVGVFPSMRAGPAWGSVPNAMGRTPGGASGVNADFLGNVALTFGGDRLALVASSGLSLNVLSPEDTALPTLTLSGVPVLGTLMWAPFNRLSFQVGAGVIVGSLSVDQAGATRSESTVGGRVHGGLTWLVMNSQSVTLGLSADVNYTSASSAAAEFSSTGLMFGVSLAFSADALSPSGSRGPEAIAAIPRRCWHSIVWTNDLRDTEAAACGTAVVNQVYVHERAGRPDLAIAILLWQPGQPETIPDWRPACADAPNLPGANLWRHMVEHSPENARLRLRPLCTAAEAMNPRARPVQTPGVAPRAPEPVAAPGRSEPTAREVLHRERAATVAQEIDALQRAWDTGRAPQVLRLIQTLQGEEPALVGSLIEALVASARARGADPSGSARARGNALAGIVTALRAPAVRAAQIEALEIELHAAAAAAFDAAVTERAREWRTVSEWLSPDAFGLRREVESGAGAAVVARYDQAAEAAALREFDAIHSHRADRSRRALQVLDASGSADPAPAFLRRAMAARGAIFMAAARVEVDRRMRDGRPWGAALFARRLLILDDPAAATWVRETELRASDALAREADRLAHLDGLSLLNRLAARSLRHGPPPQSDPREFRSERLLMRMPAADYARCAADVGGALAGMRDFLEEPESRWLALQGDFVGCSGSGAGGALVATLHFITPLGRTPAPVTIQLRGGGPIHQQAGYALAAHRRSLPSGLVVAVDAPQGLLEAAEALRPRVATGAIDLYVWAMRSGVALTDEQRRWVAGQYGVGPEDLPRVRGSGGD